MIAKSHYTCTCIKSSKEYYMFYVKNIARLHKCIHVMTIWDMRKSMMVSFWHNCLIGTITFKVHPITPTSPRIHACNHIQSIFDLFPFHFTCIFLFKQIMHGQIRERKEILNDGKLLTFQFCYAEAHKCHWHYTFVMPKHTGVISWLASNNGEMVIYAFLLGFSCPSRQKEWY